MNKNIVQIENTSYAELLQTLGEMIGGNYVSINDIPNIELNAKQAAAFLGIANNTLIKFMEEGIVKNVGNGARVMFSLPQLFNIRTEIGQLKYVRYERDAVKIIS